jgi:hypothetical protein
MSPRKRTQDISAKQVVSGGILFGLMTLPVLAFARDFPNLHSDAHVFDHYWIYGTISLLGCILAWAMPNSMIAWSNNKKPSGRISTTCLIGFGTSGILMHVIRKSLTGVITVVFATVLLWALGALIVAISRAFYRRKHRA